MKFKLYKLSERNPDLSKQTWIKTVETDNMDDLLSILEIIELIYVLYKLNLIIAIYWD